MSLLTHKLLLRLADAIDQSISPLRWIDLYAAQYVLDCHGGGKASESDALAAITVALSFAGTRGETCLSLSALNEHLPKGVLLPSWSATEWIELLSASSAVEVTDASTQASASNAQGQGELLFDHYDHYPLVLAGDKLYLTRYWQLEQNVDQWLQDRLAESIDLEESDWQYLGEQLRELFSFSSDNIAKGNAEIDWQACAAAQTLRQKVSLITGGPGTGKTTTAAHILRLLVAQHRMIYAHAPKIRLLAPTGKAAIRLQQSIYERFQSKQDLTLASLLPNSGETIHRFLIDARQSRSNQQDNYLLANKHRVQADVDIVLVDEASMIDVALMANFLSVLPESVRIVMLGDHHQLPAVEPGQVFSKWIRQYQEVPYSTEQAKQIANLLGLDATALNQHGEAINPVCQLKKTYRFGGELKQIADLMKSGSAKDLKAALQTMRENDRPDGAIQWCDIVRTDIYIYHGVAYEDYFKAIQTASTAEELAQSFSKYQVLCSTHEGPLGAKMMNQMIERHHGMAQDVYHGKAIMVTENHTALGVFNGDIGFFIRKPSGHYVVAFPDSASETLIELAPASIRAWQPAYAITVHKSQGSEYDHVSLVLADYAKELLSRAMLYTGLTRAKSKADLWMSMGAIESALK